MFPESRKFFVVLYHRERKQPHILLSDKTNILTFLPLHLSFAHNGTSKDANQTSDIRQALFIFNVLRQLKTILSPQSKSDSVTSSNLSGLLKKYPSQNSSLQHGYISKCNHECYAHSDITDLSQKVDNLNMKLKEVLIQSDIFDQFNRKKPNSERSHL